MVSCQKESGSKPRKVSRGRMFQREKTVQSLERGAILVCSKNSKKANGYIKANWIVGTCKVREIVMGQMM